MKPAIERLTLLKAKAWFNAEPQRLAADQLVQELKHVARAAGLEAQRLEGKDRSGIAISFPAQANIAVAVTVETNGVGDILVWCSDHAQQSTRLQLEFDAVQGHFVPRNKVEPLDELAETAAQHLEMALKASGLPAFQTP